MARVRPVRTPWGVGHIQKAGAAWAKALRRLNYVFSLSGRRSPLACRIQPPSRRPISATMRLTMLVLAFGQPAPGVGEAQAKS